MGFFLGIDGGGTKTSCLVGDEKSVLGSGMGGGSNVLRVGEAQARESLVDAVRQACDAASINPARINRTCVGVAGAARREVAAVVRKILSDTVAGEIEIVGDMVIALHAAFGAGPGVIVIAGTGSIAYGRDSQGQTARAGGLGFAVSDEGSGHWIGRAAVTAALRADDPSQSALLQAIMKDWNVKGRDAVALAASASPAPDFATLFPAVLSAGDSGDGIAVEILSRAGRELAALAKTVIGRLFPGADRVPLAISGGVFRNSALVRVAFYNELQSECLQAVIDKKIVDPVRGALELARRGSRAEQQIPHS